MLSSTYSKSTDSRKRPLRTTMPYTSALQPALSLSVKAAPFEPAPTTASSFASTKLSRACCSVRPPRSRYSSLAPARCSAGTISVPSTPSSQSGRVEPLVGGKRGRSAPKVSVAAAPTNSPTVKPKRSARSSSETDVGKQLGEDVGATASVQNSTASGNSTLADCGPAEA